MKSDQGCRRQATGWIERGLILAGIALAIAAPAAAQRDGRFELGLDLGVVYLGGELRDGDGPISHLRAGLFLTKRFELEGQWSRADTDVDADLDRVLLNAVFNLAPSETGQSYLLVGIGQADLDFEDFVPGDREEHSSTVQVAAGRRFFLGPGSRLAARFEVSLWREQVLDAGSTVNAALTGGLTWRSGAAPPRLGVVGGRAWIDEDGDGQDATGSEPSLPGVSVSISRDGEAAAPPDVTDEEGRYAFAPLEPGVYQLDFSAPAELRIAPGGSPRMVEVTPGGQVEAGLGALRRVRIGLSVEYREGGVEVRIWADRDRDGSYAKTEGLGGIALRLTRDG